jgi:hypothetical protein
MGDWVIEYALEGPGASSRWGPMLYYHCCCESDKVFICSNSFSYTGDGGGGNNHHMGRSDYNVSCLLTKDAIAESAQQRRAFGVPYSTLGAYTWRLVLIVGPKFVRASCSVEIQIESAVAVERP